MQTHTHLTRVRRSYSARRGYFEFSRNWSRPTWVSLVMKRQTLCLEFQVHTCSAPVTPTMIPVGRWSVEEHYMFLTPYTQSQKLARVTKGLSWQSLFTRVLLHRLRKKNCLLRNSTDLPWRRRSAYSHSAPPTTCPRLQFSAHLEACYFRYRR